MMNHEKREEISNFIVTLYDIIDPTKKNSSKFVADTKSLSKASNSIYKWRLGSFTIDVNSAKN